MNRLKEFYDAEIVDAMTKQFSYKNKMAGLSHWQCC